MKYLLLGLLLHTTGTLACLIGPKKIALEPTVFEKYQFTFEAEKSDFCEECS